MSKPTHHIFVRTAIEPEDEWDQLWAVAPDEVPEYQEFVNRYSQGVTVTAEPLTAWLRIEDATVTLMVSEKLRLHDEGEYQFRPITP